MFGQKINPDKKDKFGVSRNDIKFDVDDIIRIPQLLIQTHKMYPYFIKRKDRYRGKRAKVNELYYTFNSYWRVNFSWISGYQENSPEFHLCFVVCDFLGANPIKVDSYKLFGILTKGNYGNNGK